MNLDILSGHLRKWTGETLCRLARISGSQALMHVGRHDLKIAGKQLAYGQARATAMNKARQYHRHHPQTS